MFTIMSRIENKQSRVLELNRVWAFVCLKLVAAASDVQVATVDTALLYICVPNPIFFYPLPPLREARCLSCVYNLASFAGEPHFLSPDPGQ